MVTANVVSCSLSGFSRPSVDITLLASTAKGRDFKAGDKYDLGELQLECQFDPTAAGKFLSCMDPDAVPVVNAPVAITWSGAGAGAIWTTTHGFVTNIDIDPVAIDEVIMATVTVKLSGVVVIS